MFESKLEPGDVITLRNKAAHNNPVQGGRNHKWAVVESIGEMGEVYTVEDLACSKWWKIADVQKVPLSSAQKKTLREVCIRFPNGEWFSAYDAQCHLKTLQALAEKKLLQQDASKPGALSFPRTAITFRVNR